jgi:hypothetical protein
MDGCYWKCIHFPRTSSTDVVCLFVSLPMTRLASGAGGVRLSTSEVSDRFVGMNPMLLFIILYVHTHRIYVLNKVCALNYVTCDTESLRNTNQ